ncbi:hypothetical protein EDB84DRAFT_1563956 [Lactarius hengduanensis]|nr:hypothetical protein EDB84DRAFT_1563956 [Lactarius hengduanensis]
MAATSPDRTDPATTTTTSTPLRHRHPRRPPQLQCTGAISTRPPPPTLALVTHLSHLDAGHPPSRQVHNVAPAATPLAVLTPSPTATAPSPPQCRRHPNRARLDTAPTIDAGPCHPPVPPRRRPPPKPPSPSTLPQSGEA